MPEDTTKKLMRTRLAVVIVVLVAGAAAWYLWPAISGFVGSSRTASDVMREASALSESMRQNNADYASALAARNVGNFAEAEALLERARDAEVDYKTRGLIGYVLADTYAALGKDAEAVELLKKQAADERYARIVRAHAVQKMAVLYYQYRDQNITTIIFADSPYKEMQDTDSVYVSYRSVFEYASSLYPLALSELHIAEWYANDALRRTKQGEGGLKVARDIDAAKARLARAERHISAVENGSMEDVTYMRSILQRAIVYGKLEALGEYNDAEPAFKEVLRLIAEKDHTIDGNARVAYAIYLAQKSGSARASDIQAILAPLVAEPHMRMWSRELGALGRVRLGALKNSYTLVASIDPAFKTLLMRYGWTEADFSL